MEPQTAQLPVADVMFDLRQKAGIAALKLARIARLVIFNLSAFIWF